VAAYDTRQVRHLGLPQLGSSAHCSLTSRLLKHWRCTGRGEAYRAMFSCPNDFTILS
jgi:hypothetical protein